MLKIPKYLPLAIMLLLLISFNSIVNANILNRQVISAGGGNITTGNETLIYTFGQPFILPISQPPLQTGFLFPFSNGGESPSCDTTQEKWICVEFQGLRPSYNIGDLIQVDVNININVERFERVDLWVAIQVPPSLPIEGKRPDNLIFRVNEISMVSVEPQAFIKSLQETETARRVLEFEVTQGYGGDYIFYAAYVEEGKNPMTDGFTVLKSNLATKGTVLYDR